MPPADLTPATTTALPAAGPARGQVLSPLDALDREAQQLAARHRAPATLDKYQRAWAAFAGWCAAQGLDPWENPRAVRLYLTARRHDLAVATLQQHLAAIRYQHRRARRTDPTGEEDLKDLWEAIRRERGRAPTRKVAPLETAPLAQLCAACALPPPAHLGGRAAAAWRLRGLRDRALLLLGFATGQRRGTLVALDVPDLTEVPEGLLVWVARSKTDQEGRGRHVRVPAGTNPLTCPVRAWRAWREALGGDRGPAFRPVSRHGEILPRRLSGHAVAAIIKRRCEEAGLDPAGFSGHSLRRGLAVAADRAGVPLGELMAHVGWKSADVAAGYQEASGWARNPAARVGL